MYPNLSKTGGKKLVMFGLNIGKIVVIKINNSNNRKKIRILLAPKKINNDEIKPTKAFLEFVEIIKNIMVEEIKNAEILLILELRFFVKKYNEKGKLTANQKPA